jgi:hypothetical protein
MSQQEQQPRYSADDKISLTARTWRASDKEAIANKRDPRKQQAEYFARQQLRKAVDEADE